MGDGTSEDFEQNYYLPPREKFFYFSEKFLKSSLPAGGLQLGGLYLFRRQCVSTTLAIGYVRKQKLLRYMLQSFMQKKTIKLLFPSSQKF